MLSPILRALLAKLLILTFLGLAPDTESSDGLLNTSAHFSTFKANWFDSHIIRLFDRRSRLSILLGLGLQDLRIGLLSALKVTNIPYPSTPISSFLTSPIRLLSLYNFLIILLL